MRVCSPHVSKMRKGFIMDEKEKELPEASAQEQNDLGELENTAQSEDVAAQSEAAEPKAARAPLSPRTKKRIILAAVVTGALLLVLAAVLITVSILNNRPPKFEEVRGRFEQLITDSQEINEIVWGAGLPVYTRVDAESQVFEAIIRKGDGTPVLDDKGEPYKAKLRYYLYEDATYGKIVSYEVSSGNVGRNAEELLRKLQACQFVYDHGDEVCPAKWQPGGETLKPSLDLVGML